MSSLNPFPLSSTHTSSTPVVSASAYLSQAPSSSTTDTYSRDEVRRLVLDYLCSGCYAHSAKAFAQEVERRDREGDDDDDDDEDEEDDHEQSSSSGAARAGRGGSGSSRSRTQRSDHRPTQPIHDDGMEGIEATPEPEGWRATAPGGGVDVDFESDESKEAIEVHRALRGHTAEVQNGNGNRGAVETNGKAVAFELMRQDYDRDGGEENGDPEMDDDQDEDRGEVELDRFSGNKWLSQDQLGQVRLRRDIRDAILTGRIQSAIEMLKEHFPAVLSDPPITTKSSKSSSACTPTSFFVSTPSSSAAAGPSSSRPSTTTSHPPGASTLGVHAISRPGTPKPIVPILGATFGSWSLSLDPQILALNLQLQSFVELMRGAHSSSSISSTPSTPNYSTTSGHGNGNSTTLSDSMHSDAGLSGSTASLTSSTHALNIAIAQSQALNQAVAQLPSGRDRDRWEQECIDVSGLMAYKDLMNCPVRGYLEQERRVTLSELVNAAILTRSGHTPLSILALAARSTTAVWSAVAELKVPFGPAMAPPTKESKSKHRVYARFDLRTFLAESEHEVGGLFDPKAASS